MLPRHLHTTLIAGIITGLFASAALAPPAHARKRSRAPKAAETSKRPEKAAKSPAPSSDVAPVEKDVPATPPPAGTPAPAPKPRVYTFSGLDVNGNLKAPQLLFFRGRVKQELDTSNPEKRSFLKELERTADAEGL